MDHTRDSRTAASTAGRRPGVPRRFPRRLAAAACFVLAAAGCDDGPVMATYAGEDRMESFMQANFTRFFNVHVPERAELGPAAPVVLAFHGTSQTGELLRQQSGLDAMADAEGFIVVYLEAAMGAWDIFGDLGFLGLDELGYVREVIERVDRAYVIDERRILAVGLSNGGVMAQQLACKLSDRIAGIVVVAATMPRRIANECEASRPVSALYVMGTADPFFPAAGNSVLLSMGETVEFWGRVNGCSGQRIRADVPDVPGDGTTVFLSWYRPCRDGVRTGLDSIVGGGHTWPGGAVPGPPSFGPTSRDISANAEIARFAKGIPRR